jgi:CBS domain-containing protein
MAESEYNDYIDEELAWFEDEKTRRSIGVTARTLNLPLRLVPPRQAVVVRPSDSVLDVLKKMQEHRTGAVLVKNLDGYGIVTERDVVMKIPGGGKPAAEVPVSEIMTPDPLTLGPDDTIAFAMNYMAIGGYRHIPIMDDGGEPVGLLSVRDLLRFVVDFFPEEVTSLPPKPQTNGMPRYGG